MFSVPAGHRWRVYFNEGEDTYDTSNVTANRICYIEGEYAPDGVTKTLAERDLDVIEFGEQGTPADGDGYPAPTLKPTAFIMKAVADGSATPALMGSTGWLSPNMDATYYPGDVEIGGVLDVYGTVNTAVFSDNEGTLTVRYETDPGYVGGSWNDGTMGGRWDKPTKENIKNWKYCEETGLGASQSIVTDSQGRQVIDWFADED